MQGSFCWTSLGSGLGKVSSLPWGFISSSVTQGGDTIWLKGHLEGHLICGALLVTVDNVIIATVAVTVSGQGGHLEFIGYSRAMRL